MPRRRQYYNTRARQARGITIRRAKRPQSGRAYVARIPRNRYLTGFPKEMKMKHRYVDTVSLDATATTPAIHRFRCNSVFDPDYTGTGHQPLYRDLMVTIYNHYVVTGSKITVKFTNAATSANYQSASVCGVYLDDNSTDHTIYTTLMENGRGQSKMLAQAATRGGDSVTCRQKFSAKKFFGVKDVKDNITRIGAAVAANPSEDAYFVVFSQGVQPSAVDNPLPILATVIIEYAVIWSERTEQPES